MLVRLSLLSGFVEPGIRDSHAWSSNTWTMECCVVHVCEPPQIASMFNVLSFNGKNLKRGWIDQKNL